MSFERVRFNTTQEIRGADSTLGSLTGRSDLVHYRNMYQKELDNAHAAIVNMTHYVEEQKKILDDQYNNAQRLKRDIAAHTEERTTLYETLEHLLNNETTNEKEIWFETLKSRVHELGNRNISVIQNMKESDIDSMSVGLSSNYPKQLLNSQSGDRYRKIFCDIEEKDKSIRKSKHAYNNAVSEYNTTLSQFNVIIKKARDKFEAYYEIKKIAREAMDKCRYKYSFFYKISNAKSKGELEVDTLKHRVNQFKNTLDIIENEISKFEGRKFVEMSY
jgi:hypothetical protein